MSDGEMELVKKLSKTKTLYSILKMFNIGDPIFNEVNKRHLDKRIKL